MTPEIELGATGGEEDGVDIPMWMNQALHAARRGGLRV